MKLHSILISILLLLVSLIFSGCSKNKAHDEYIPEQLKQYSVFQMGSYWVFKNESTEAIDWNPIQFFSTSASYIKLD